MNPMGSGLGKSFFMHLTRINFRFYYYVLSFFWLF
uniref:Uncharacterized protein n=1 Tax=Rhizophora mucronata TaxID=61149 RepID=A0A2P2QJJ3_RHIMU